MKSQQSEKPLSKFWCSSLLVSILGALLAHWEVCVSLATAIVPRAGTCLIESRPSRWDSGWLPHLPTFVSGCLFCNPDDFLGRGRGITVPKEIGMFKAFYLRD